MRGLVIRSGNSQVNQSPKQVLTTSGNVGPSPKGSIVPNEEIRLENDRPVSSSTSVRSSIPEYHFHGLANTQTDSDRSAGLAREDSLKENASSSESQEFPGLHFTSASDLHLSSLPQIMEGHEASESHAQNQWGYRSRPVTPQEDENMSERIRRSATPASGPSSVMNASYDSLPLPVGDAPPGMVRTRTFPARTQPKRTLHKTRSPGSQDSFAGDLPHDVQRKLYVQSSKVYNASLSDLLPKSAEDEDNPHPLSQPSAYRATSSRITYQEEESQESNAALDQDSQPSAYRAISSAPYQRLLIQIDESVRDDSQGTSELSQSCMLTPSEEHDLFPKEPVRCISSSLSDRFNHACR